MWRALIKTLRPKQWVKNLLIFAPLIFAQALFNAESVYRAVLMFGSFCLLASATYVVNDILDCEEDRRHPTKKNRPIAAGLVSVNVAWMVAVLTMVFGLLIAWLLGWAALMVALGYLVLTSAYSVYLKRQVLVDVLVLAIGFVLRALAGAVAIGVVFSSWLMVTTLFLALFLALGKRRHELLLLAGQASSHRRSLEDYSEALLDQLIMIVATVSLVSYILYTLDAHTVQRFGAFGLAYTVPVVVYGLFRYFFLVHKRADGGNPTDTLLGDMPLLISVVVWGVVVVGLVYSQQFANLF